MWRHWRQNKTWFSTIWLDIGAVPHLAEKLRVNGLFTASIVALISDFYQGFDWKKNVNFCNDTYVSDVYRM